MELRKIQRTRGGTFFVTIPKEWAISTGITQGSVVSTHITPNGRLVIEPYSKLEPAPLSTMVKPTQYLSREIIGKYLLGYDIIRIEAKDRITIDQREIVKETAHRLIGLEVIEEDYTKIVLQCLLEPSALSPEKILRREYLISSAMYKDAVKAFVDADTQLARSVVARDNEVDRLYFLLVRILRTIVLNPTLSEKLEVYPIECLDYRLTASFVESIADQSTQIAEQAVRLNGAKLDKDSSELILELSNKVQEAYSDSLAAFFSRDVSIAESVRQKHDIVERLCQSLESISNTLPIDLTQKIISVMSLMNRIYYYCVDISDLTTPKIWQS
ncbi:MAG: phosphate uptake regulator PhoU [Nitrososphaerota archaeon]|nr:phosphate uptake regulator PhoU [Nitrososphaerota archaeon]